MIILQIAVCIATYNGEKYIERQLTSILKQLRRNDEVIIVDDCSKDSTVAIIQDMQDDRIKLYTNHINIGFLATFERSLSLVSSTSEIVFLSDQDDIWMDNKVEKILYCFRDKTIDIIAHDAIIIDENNHILHRSFTEIRRITTSTIKNIISNSYTGCCLAFRANVKKVIMPIPRQASYHDRWIGIIGKLYGMKITFIPDKLIYYVRHNNNASPAKRRDLITIVLDRFGLLESIVKHFVNRKIRIKN